MSKLLATELLQHVLQAPACFLLVEACPSHFVATAFEKSLDVLAFDFVILDVEVLDKTYFSICLWKDEVLADVFKSGPLASFMTSGRSSQALSQIMALRLSTLRVRGSTL